MQPHEYPNRILVCVSGLSPQIVTETLYALAVETHGRPAFVPTEIHLISTALGAEQAQLSLLAPDRDQFGKLCRDYGLEGIRFDASMIEIITDKNGRPMQDIRTPADNEAAADAITRKIASLTRAADAAVHVSIAGGRKSMGFFSGYALSLYGRQQDRLSHVLVSERYEGHADFFFKPKKPMTLQHRDNRAMSTDQAEIHLAEIPFIPLREGLHQPLLEGKAGYAETVRNWHRSSSEGELRLDPARCRVSWHGVSLKLTPIQFAIYAGLAALRASGTDDGWLDKQKLQSDDAYQNSFIRRVSRICDMSLATDKIEEVFSKEKPEGYKHAFYSPAGTSKDWLPPHISRINKIIADEMDELAAKRIGIEKEGKRNFHRYRLAIAPEFIRVK